MATRKELLKLAAMANTLTSQMSTLATAIFTLIEQEEAVASAKLMDFPRKLKPNFPKPTKARKVKRGGKKTKKVVAKADETPKVEEKK